MKYFYLLSLFVILSIPCSTAIFTSSQNGNWSSSLTWGGAGVPTASDNVVINHTVTLTANTTVTNVTINNGGTLDVAINNYSLTVKGNWTKNGGTFTARAGTVIFSGIADKTIGEAPLLLSITLLLIKVQISQAYWKQPDLSACIQMQV